MLRFGSALLVAVAVGVSAPDVGVAVVGMIGSSGVVLVASGHFVPHQDQRRIVGPNRFCIPDGGSCGLTFRTSIFALL